MSTAQQDNVYWLPPQEEQRMYFALFLQARRALRRATEAARHVPRAAAGFIARITQARLLDIPIRLLSVFGARIGGLAAPLIARARRHPWATGLGLLLTSTQARSAGSRLLCGALTGLRQMWRTAIRLTTVGLLRLGAPGRIVVESVQAWTQRTGAVLRQRLAPLAFLATVAWRTSKALRSALVRLLRSYLTHKALARLVRSRVRLAFLEAVILPMVANSRLVVWMRSVLRRKQDADQGPTSEERTGPTTPPAAPTAAESDSRRPTTGRPTSAASLIKDEVTEPDDLETPGPGNRAERRAMEREQARQQRRPKAS